MPKCQRISGGGGVRNNLNLFYFGGVVYKYLDRPNGQPSPAGSGFQNTKKQMMLQSFFNGKMKRAKTLVIIIMITIQKMKI